MAYLVRPFGGIILGPLGDRIGRKKVLALTIVVMSGASFCVGLLPTFAAVGWLAPILLILLRMVQGFATGGEYGGAAAFIAEYAPDKRRGFYCSFLELGTTGGFVLAAGMVTALQVSLPPGGHGRLGLAHPVPRRGPARPGRSVPAHQAGGHSGVPRPGAEGRGVGIPAARRGHQALAARSSSAWAWCCSTTSWSTRSCSTCPRHRGGHGGRARDRRDPVGDAARHDVGHYNISTSLFGGTAPVILAFLVTTTGNNAIPGAYVAVASLISLAAVVVVRESARKPLPGSAPSVLRKEVAQGTGRGGGGG